MTGVPGTVTPMTLISGLVKWLAYQIEGAVSSRSGSLANIAWPDLLLVLSMAKLLLPFKGFCLLIDSLTRCCTSNFSGFCGSLTGSKSKGVSLGITGDNVPSGSGNKTLKRSSPNIFRKLVCSISASLLESVLANRA